MDPTAADYVLVAQDVVDVLNASDLFDPGFVVVRRYRIIDPSAAAGLAVSVLGKPMTEDLMTRGSTTNDIEVDVAIVQKLASPEDLAELDPLTLLLKQIGDYLKADDDGGKSRKVLPTTLAKLIKRVYAPCYDQKTLVENQVFVGVQRLTYRMTENYR